MGRILFASLAFLVAPSDDAGRPTEVLERLLLPPEALPADCSLGELLHNPIAPAKTNPYITADDEQFIRFLAIFVDPSFDRKHILAAGLAVYGQRDEVGVYALYLRESVETLRSRGVLKRKPILSKDAKLLTRDHVWALLWRDAGAPDSCLEAIERQVERQLK